MADIELVVKIDEEVYEFIKQSMTMDKVKDYHALLYGICEHIANSTLLPKDHGRIGDLDKLIKAMKERNDDNGGEPLNAVDRGYDLAFQHMIKESKECVIIEADTENEDKE